MEFLKLIFPISIFKQIFDNDAHSIISKKGQKYLSDKNKMKEIENKIKKSNEKIITL